MEYYGGTEVAPFTGPELAAQDYAMRYAAGIPGMMAPGVRGAQWLAGGGAADVYRNPYVREMGRGMVGDIKQSLMSDVLPEISDRYRRGGAFGGSKENLAVGRAVEGATRQMQRGLTDLYGGAYGQGLQAMGTGLGALPGLVQTGRAPVEMMSQVGGAQRGMTQDLIDAAMRKHQFQQMEPYERLQRYSGTVQGQNWGSEQLGPKKKGSGLAGAAGGAMMGAKVGSMFGPVGTVAGGLLGGLGGYFMGG